MKTGNGKRCMTNVKDIGGNNTDGVGCVSIRITGDGENQEVK